MNAKVFYNDDLKKWFAFEAPEKPNPKDYGVDNKNYFNRSNGKTRWYIRKSKEYEKAYAEAKANALEIGNPEIIISNTPLGGFEIQFIDGVGCSTWPGKSEIKDGKYILSI